MNHQANLADGRRSGTLIERGPVRAVVGDPQGCAWLAVSARRCGQAPGIDQIAVGEPGLAGLVGHEIDLTVSTRMRLRSCGHHPEGHGTKCCADRHWPQTAPGTAPWQFAES